MDLVTIPATTVELRKGKPMKVPAFATSFQPVSACQFALYAKKTMFVSIAEIKNEEFTFWENPLFDGVPPIDVAKVPATCLRVDEAERSCRFFGGRLPTRREWLAMRLWFQESGVASKPGSFGQLRFCGDEWLRDSDSPNGIWVGSPPPKPRFIDYMSEIPPAFFRPTMELPTFITFRPVYSTLRFRAKPEKWK
ncbi:MAG TPA: SUMF1/EgtB/PvdO family nonheme iron enzyme [Methylomirabilota bacterium]|nr:SUMF1/EgtB/PvdO family nonheme iron enzyme [Methylomirabilota bacterium]